MRLPLVLLQGEDAEQTASSYPDHILILNTGSELPAPVRLSGSCVCCSGQSQLRDTLNQIYIDWAHDRDRIKGAVLIAAPEAILSDLEEFLSDDAILAARWSLKIP